MCQHNYILYDDKLYNEFGVKGDRVYEKESDIHCISINDCPVVFGY